MAEIVLVFEVVCWTARIDTWCLWCLYPWVILWGWDICRTGVSGCEKCKVRVVVVVVVVVVV
jgi:hypothetical protein